MPGPSRDREPSPAPSHPHAEDQGDAAVDESTPFLSSDHRPATPSSPKTIHIVTALALTFSILALVSLFATAVAQQAGPVSFNLPWSTKEGMNGVVAPVRFLPQSTSHGHAVVPQSYLAVVCFPFPFSSFTNRQSSPSSSQPTTSAASAPTTDRHLPSRSTCSSTSRSRSSLSIMARGVCRVCWMGRGAGARTLEATMRFASAGRWR